MAGKRKLVGFDTETQRKLIGALTHDDIYLLGWAVETAADVLGAVDRFEPDPERRDRARRLQDMAASLYQSNQARPFLEGKE